ncbi:MAG: LacI family DNA-binding transcriptional regulator [Armatimonadetes bacterium]|nr:LacI family DNA-binding transcriptional regulator [Armatimonadota bacterium]
MTRVIGLALGNELCHHQDMITMSEVARRAGVARSTVSHVLSARHGGNVRIPEATRQRVLQAARELGYRPNALARSVRTGKSRMIGYLVDDPRYEPYWNTIIGALGEAEREGFTLKLLSVTDETLEQRIEQCIELRLSGLIVRVSQDKRPLFEEADRAGIPVVTVDESDPQPFGLRVAADDALGIREALAHLAGLGHHRIAFISSGFHRQRDPQRTPPREAMFRAEMAARGLDVPEGRVTYETMLVYGREAGIGLGASTVLAATDALLEHPDGRPTAIFCWRDETALVALRACRLQGLRVPEDISVVGFSDIIAARLSDPPLTTCQSPWEEMGRTAMRRLIHAQGEEFNPSPRAILIPSGLAVRQSSGPNPE